MSTIPSPSSAAVPAREPAAAALAQAAERTAGDLLTPPAPHRLDEVVPAPRQVELGPAGAWVLPPDAIIAVSADPAALAVAEQLAGLLRPATGYPLPVTDAITPEPAGGIALVLNSSADLGAGHDSADPGAGHDSADPGAGHDSADLGAEGYRLDITTDGVRLTAATAAGLFYGVQTLRQLLPAAIESPVPVTERWALPRGTITDAPRFPYRGAMLDVARHFFGVEDVLRVIDHLARYKLNHLHLHLTDDQGWRITVDSWPELTTVGAATEVGGGPGGHYTKADYARIVAYATARHITVVPEIDLPGHTNSALVAYPHLAPDKIAPPPYTGTEVGFSYVDPSDERTYDFVADVLGEVAALTPGPWLHVGGDEAFKVKGAVYTGFVERVQRIVADLGKSVVGWHQLAPAAHSDGRVLQWWGTNGEDPTTADAVRRGARLVLSPGNHAYLDMKYAPDTPIGHDWAGLIDVHTAYDWDPGSHVADVPATAVLGVEAPLWTESVTSLTDIEFLLLPRLPAIAELGWSPRHTHDWANFRDRLAGQGPRWTAAGITFHRAPEIPWPSARGIPGQRPAPEADTAASRPDGSNQS
ncbi:beta-N-acetylhexosaminidase [Micromonospora sp. WMMD1120]|uniref:beta-N-acetylhexosaminidase n=1 Tax=Micromonospora sp. WMMD1120 TaxID=3016106 RepID=UPI002417FF86|nr:beta-N-acetylhexosaminidase [Micromonospora sp. WMMD1120]MDG4805637.1 beta-N-acetylhexosaminidase [Micromonospora sp. WMMD1120]